MIANQQIQTKRVDQSKARCKLYWDLGSGGGGAKEPQKDPPPSFSHHSPPPTVSPIFLSPADCSHCQWSLWWCVLSRINRKLFWKVLAYNNVFRRGMKRVYIGTGMCGVWCVVAHWWAVSVWSPLGSQWRKTAPHTNRTTLYHVIPQRAKLPHHTFLGTHKHKQEARQNCTKPSTSCDAGHTCARLLTTMSEQTNIACGVLQMRRWFDLTRAGFCRYRKKRKGF